MSTPLVLRNLSFGAMAGLAMVGFVTLPGAVLGGVMVGVFVGGAVALRLRVRSEIDVATCRRTVISAGATALWIWLIGTGVVGLLGPSIESVLIAVLVVGVPAAFHVRRGFRAVEPAAPAPPSPVVVASPAIDTLTTPELCLTWRRSYLTLVELPAGAARVELVAARQSILDELERRDGDGFRRWLDAGARAGGDPARFLAIRPGA